MSIFSNNLRFLRESKGLKQEDFDFLGIKKGTMSNYELGNTEPKLSLLCELSKFFGYSIDDLLKKDLSNITINDRFSDILQKVFNGNIEEFSLRSEIPQSILLNIIGNKKENPTYDVKKRIINNLNISEEWLINGIGPMTIIDEDSNNKNAIYNKSIIKQKILSLLKEKNISQYEFYSKSGVTKGVLTQNNGISEENLMKVMDFFPDINVDWLIKGEGEKNKHNDENKNLQTYTKKIPLIPVNAMAGLFAGETSINDYDCTYYDIPAFRGADFLITVKGDSMRPSFNSGDIVACHKLALSDIFFQWNKVYVLDTNQGALIKRVKPGSDDNHIRIISDNPDFDPFELSKDSIYNIALVLGVIKQL